MVVTTLNDHQQPFPTRHIQNTRNESMRGFCHQTLYASLLTWLGHLATWELELGAFLYVSFCEAHASTCLSFYRPTFLSTCVSIYILVCFRIYLSIYLSFFLSFFLSVFLSFFLSFRLSVFLHTSTYVSATVETKPTSPARQSKHIPINTVVHLVRQQWRLCPRVPLEHLARLLAHALHVMSFVQIS